MKYFAKVGSYKELKETYRDLLKKNHPDNGGSVEIMQEINTEYDVAFRIWKNRAENLTEEEQKETAQSTRRHFYTQNGWSGTNYDSKLTLKEIAAIVRSYVKENYPTCKFSVRTSYASMCQELHVEIKEFPAQMWKTGADLKKEGLYNHVVCEDGFEYNTYKEEVEQMRRRMSNNGFFDRDSWTDDELILAYDEMLTKTSNYSFYAIPTDYFKTVIDDVDALVKSYNYEDCDGMIDYFDVNFYYFGCKTSECKQVEKVARIKNKESRPTTTKEEKRPEEIETSGKAYTVEESRHTKTGAKIYLVKWLDTLTRDDYISLNNKIKQIGGYYSKFTHSFIFKVDPTELLKAI